ncbi:MAG: hypothetical protein AVDCRST_MAG72-1275 [uncultured Nocardioidaceae bacterium]|uniref:HNH nuclease domain-containing protein n=1 Tax=uncultured Nocardioidaceae bacterium TaxID=253824 RepID=A0A6J4M5C2_9ACTN|nr:MAG: hypothetical protein AVDCRST_MAG72-1275 [uncultured Nocardioidaceae bacterium]
MSTSDSPTGTSHSSGGPRPGANHELLRFARAVEASLDRVTDTPVWSMTAEEQRETALLLDRLDARFAELRLRVLVGADHSEVGADSGATSTAAWLAHATRQSRASCSAALRLASQLDESFSLTRRALASGRVNLDQARAVVEAVNLLTEEYDDLPPGTRVRAEQHLLDLADEFDAVMLRRLGRRLIEVVCPEAADRAEGERLALEEERARRLAQLSTRDNGDGTVEGRFRLPVLHAQLLKKALESLTSPRRLGEGRFHPRTGKKLDHSTLLGHGFMELLESHLALDRLPTQGGSPFTVVVTISLDALTSGFGAASLDTGGRISAGEARRLACRAGIIPMVLDGASVPLDLGREQRLFTKHQRIALSHQFGGCAAKNCDRPPAWTEAHHLQPWGKGGRTDLRNGILLCPPHHHMADDPGSWDMSRLAGGGVRFARRQ